MGDTPINFSTQMFVSSLINKAIYKGLARFTGLPFFEEAHFRHFNQPDLYIDTVEGAFDPSCKRRRPGTKRRNDWSRKEERLKQKQGVISKPFNLNRCLIIKPKREKIPPKRSNNLIFGQISPKLRAKQATSRGQIGPNSREKSGHNHETNLATNTTKSGQNTGQIRPKAWTNSGQKHGPKRPKHMCQKTQKINYARQLRYAMLRGYRKETR